MVFEWCKNQPNDHYHIEVLQSAIKSQFSNMRAAPGRRKLEDLAKKYPILSILSVREMIGW